MSEGTFGDCGELLFEIELFATDGERIIVNALLDTGFTDWMAINTQDADSLDWLFLRKYEMKTARGNAIFNLYQGTVSFDEQLLTIPVVGGEEITELLLGLAWLENRRLIVDRKASILTINLAL